MKWRRLVDRPELAGGNSGTLNHRAHERRGTSRRSPARPTSAACPSDSINSTIAVARPLSPMNPGESVLEDASSAGTDRAAAICLAQVSAHQPSLIARRHDLQHATDSHARM
jgi:hypothetical protein